jgi:hypothetical protein
VGNREGRWAKPSILLLVTTLGLLGAAGSVWAECDDGIDNDGDGLVDWQYDLGCHSAQDTSEAALPRAQENGWTTFDPGVDTRIVYVSSSGGDDVNDGSSPALAVRSLGRGADLVRDGHGDFLLLRRGDVWRDQSFGRFKSGQDAAAPLVVASYGDSTERPRLEVAGHLINHDGHVREFVALVGLEVFGYRLDPGDPAFDGATNGGLRYVGGGRGLLIEDCHFQYAEVVLQSYGSVPYEDAAFRRNVVEHNYHVDTCGQNSAYRPSGMYASHVQGLLVEENLWDHNGWNEEVASACATMFNHNMYLNADGLVVRDNLILRASSMGIKMRSDATGDCDDVTFEGNLVADGEIGFGIGGNSEEPYRFSNVVIRSNVFTDVGLGNPTDRSFAWQLEISDHDSTLIEGNVFQNQPWYSNAYGIQLGGGTLRDVVVRNNIFYRLRARSLDVNAVTGWTSVRVAGNTFVDPDQGSCLVDHAGSFAPLTYDGNHYSTSAGAGDWFCVGGDRLSLAAWQAASGESSADTDVPAWPDPGRTIGGYAGTLGLPPTLEGFVAEARLQSRHDWSPELTAAAVNAYIRAGYGESGAPTLSIGDAQVTEGDAGTRDLTFTITLTE